MTPRRRAPRTRAGRRAGRRAGHVLVLAGLAAGLLLAPPLLANGGIVRISRAPVGPWLVTVYSSPTPLRTGEVDISVLVQDSADAVVDVPITVDAEPVGIDAAPVHQPATRRQATNKLFKAAKFDIHAAGPWRFRIGVGSAGARDGTAPGGAVSFDADVSRTTILDRPLLLATLVLLPLLVLAWVRLAGDGPEGPTSEPRGGPAGG